MKPRLKSTSAARDLIKRFEPFLTVAERGADGRFVVGYGHRAGAREDVTVDSESADLLLIYDVLQAERAIDETVTEPLGPPQRDALVSFALGVGLGAFRQSATARLINKGRWRDAAEAIAAWGGGMSPRRAAERELFLTDLPDDADERPVELIIEFEHPDAEPESEAPAAVPPAEMPAAPPGDQPAPGEAPETDIPVAEESIEDPEREAEEAMQAEPEPEPEPDADTMSAPAPVAGHDAVTARVIARMREQIAPRRPLATPPAPSIAGHADETAIVEDEAAQDAAPAAEADDRPLGFVFASGIHEPAPMDAPPGQPDLDEADDDDLTPAANDVDAPPMLNGNTPARARGATGEAGGLDAANDPAVEPRETEEEHAALAEDLPEPAEIDPSLAGEDEPLMHGAGWRNGDASPAPSPSSGRWGTIAVFAVGLFTMAAGLAETISRFDHYFESRTLLFGPAAVVAGFILFSGAAITMIGRLFTPREVERKSPPSP